MAELGDDDVYPRETPLHTRTARAQPPAAHRTWNLTDIACDREDASCIVTAGATANTTEGNSRKSRESDFVC